MTVDNGQPDRAHSQRYLTVAEAATMLNVSTMTLYRLINDGEFPAIRLRTRLIVPAAAVRARTADSDLVVCEPLGPGCLAVGAAARLLRVSSITLYRLISEQRFPSIRVRGRVLVPKAALDEITDDALHTVAVVDPGQRLSSSSDDWITRITDD
jgi:excisionase family DNA binding protein